MKNNIIIYDREQFPNCLRNIQAVQTICVGECINPNYKWEKHHVAHAHRPNTSYNRTICLRHKYLLHNKNILLHEAAHLIANQIPGIKPHGKEWKKILVALGGSFKPIRYSENWTSPDYTHITK